MDQMTKDTAAVGAARGAASDESAADELNMRQYRGDIHCRLDGADRHRLRAARGAEDRALGPLLDFAVGSAIGDIAEPLRTDAGRRAMRRLKEIYNRCGVSAFEMQKLGVDNDGTAAHRVQDCWSKESDVVFRRRYILRVVGDAS
jgi:hypothetical protein